MKAESLKRISVPNSPGYHVNKGLHLMMFTEDICKSLLKNNADFKISVKNEIIENLFTKLYSQTHYYHSHHNDFKESIMGVIQLIINQLVHNGRVVFELISETNGDDLSYSLVNVQGIRLKKGLFNLKQVTIGDNGKQQSTYIPRSKCIVIDFPGFLGGRKKYLKFLEDFKVLGDNDPIHLFSNKLIGCSPHYDSIKHHKKLGIELRLKSKPYKWHHRDYLGNNDMFSEFYSNLRTVEFMKTRTQLRDYVMNELNEVIKFVSNKLEIDEVSTLVFKNLISVEQLDEKIKDYKVGKLGRRKIINLM